VRTLVVENDPTDDARRLGDWLVEAGVVLHVIRPYAGDELPSTLDGYGAFVVLGGGQDAHPAADGSRAEPWFDALESLLRKAVRYRVPTLAICLGGQLLAQAHGGTVQRSPSGPEIGATLVARRDIADRDPLFAQVPFAPDVIQWHRDEITELPVGAVLLAASTRYPHQAFRIGPAAWGLQFHIECDTEMMADWAQDGIDTLIELGIDPIDLLNSIDAAQADVEVVWKPFAARFAALAKGELAPAGSSGLPLLNSQ